MIDGEINENPFSLISVYKMENLTFSVSITNSSRFLFPLKSSQLHNLKFANRKFKFAQSISITTTNSNNESEDDRIKIIESLRKDTEESLEWRSVCSQISEFASTAAGIDTCRAGKLPVGRHVEESRSLLGQTASATFLPQPLDLSSVEDLTVLLNAAVSGELLGARELCTVSRSLWSAKKVSEQLEWFKSDSENAGRFTALLDILRDCDFMIELAEDIDFCINCKLYTVLDQASKKLESVRLERKANMEELDSLLKREAVRVFQADGIDSSLITKRRSRMCIGIKASHKSLLPEGIILSVSSSGATYFMEPRAAVELNNMEVKLSNTEKEEELAVLGNLTSKVADSEATIRSLMAKIIELDLACARGAYAVWMSAFCPVFSNNDGNIQCDAVRSSMSVDIDGIQHPLLLEPFLRRLSSDAVPEIGRSIHLSRKDRYADSGKFSEVDAPVPLDIKIEFAKKVVVISGPNTGGKTATMKTLGLAALMSKAGLFLPAKKRPILPWFDEIFADIGDHQSLEHNLSTFSGHISRLCKIIKVASKESLVLIDEIGSGTDPSEGVALSTSILQHLADSVNLAVVTTHYTDLSLLSAKNSRFKNAAMEFCLETLMPTYRVLWGSTGNSNALSIAKSIGFDQKVLNSAQDWVEKLNPNKQEERQGLLYQFLLEEKNALQAQAKEAASVLSEVKKLHLELQSEAEDLDNRVASLKAKETFLVQEELKSVKTRMNAIIEDFEKRLQHISLEQAGAVIRECDAAIASIIAAHRSTYDAFRDKSDSKDSFIPQIGDKVYLKSLGDKVATVVEVPAEDGTSMVQYGKIRLRVKKNDMKLFQSIAKSTGNSSTALKGQDQRKLYRRVTSEIVKHEDVSYGPVLQTSKNTVDLRGMRTEEASRCLQIAIAASRPYTVLFVVHGMGTGAVMQCAIDILRNHPRVSKFEDESPMNYGCTIAYIK